MVMKPVFNRRNRAEKSGNATFVQNAPAAVVEQERARLNDWTVQLTGLREQRAKI